VPPVGFPHRGRMFCEEALQVHEHRLVL
jgi:hypothetical protein